MLFRQLVSIWDRLIQFKIALCAYFIPHSLHNFNSSSYWRCDHSLGHISLVFWTCPAITPSWNNVGEVIKMPSLTPPFFSPHLEFICLAWFLNAKQTLLSLLLFYAWKSITLYWHKPAPPTIHFWKCQVNSALPFYQATQSNCSCPKKKNSLKSVCRLDWGLLYSYSP